MQTQTREDQPDSPVRSRKGIVAIVLTLVAAVIGVAVLAGGFDDAKPTAGPALELNLGESNALASCLPFDPTMLVGMPVAFLGTATAIDGSTVTLSVDRWFSGGDSSTVNLVGEHQSAALIAGFEVEAGAQYLISASSGTINYCGYSGPATPELLAGYEAAFAG